jgi:hypothetical protein|tara:strand:+ start:379 stop:543 length:165 start_codon:yes stop_codon:yes gene_type:complete
LTNTERFTKRKLSGYTLTRTDILVGAPKQWTIYGKKSIAANWELIDPRHGRGDV